MGAYCFSGSEEMERLWEKRLRAAMFQFGVFLVSLLAFSEDLRAETVMSRRVVRKLRQICKESPCPRWLPKKLAQSRSVVSPPRIVFATPQSRQGWNPLDPSDPRVPTGNVDARVIIEGVSPLLGAFAIVPGPRVLLRRLNRVRRADWTYSFSVLSSGATRTVVIAKDSEGGISYRQFPFTVVSPTPNSSPTVPQNPIPPTAIATAAPPNGPAGGSTTNGGHGSMSMPNNPPPSGFPTGTTGITTLALVPGGSARSQGARDTFRTRVAWTHYSYDDPIVYPGQRNATHLHLFFGNALIDAMTTPQNIRSRCRSAAAGGTANCSGYWMPAVLNSNLEVVPPTFSLWYYKAGYQVATNRAVVPPVGLAMLLGKARATPSNPQDLTHMNWSCGGQSSKVIPSCPQGSTLALSINFPTCWNGRDLDSPDHISHMAYGNGQSCPSSHPVQIPTLTLNVEWELNTNRDPRLRDTGGWRLSSDMYNVGSGSPGGHSLHADWINGWDPAIMQRFITNCNNAQADCGVDLLNDGQALDISHLNPMSR